MITPSLHDIEKTLCTLWMDRKARERFLDGPGKSKRLRITALDSLPPELLAEVDEKGVRLYAGLLNYGHQEVVRSVYPGCAKLIGDKWEDVVDQYLELYPPSHYNLNRTAEKFPEYLGKHGERYIKRFPFIAELADYEWLELEIMEREGEIRPRAYEPLTAPEQLLQTGPLVNPVLAVRHYHFPIAMIVDRLESDHRLPRQIEPKPAWLAVYRQPVSYECKFLEIGETAYCIIEAAREGTRSYKDLVSLAVARSPGVDPQQCVVDFLELVDKLQSLSLFIGSVDTSL